MTFIPLALNRVKTIPGEGTHAAWKVGAVEHSGVGEAELAARVDWGGPLGPG
jgi:hypothetical protein